MACPLAAVYWETGVLGGIALLGISRFRPGDVAAHLQKRGWKRERGASCTEFNLTIKTSCASVH